MQNQQDLEWLKASAAPLDSGAQQAAIEHNNQLTKPPGSLGELEKIAVQFAAWQGQERPKISQPIVRVFAADHGVCAQGVSAFPQAVTAQMIANFVSGGAAISVLSKQAGANFNVINLGTVAEIPDLSGDTSYRIADQSADFTCGAAMSETQLANALAAGAAALDIEEADLFIAGDMGIGNTTSASAIYSAVLGVGADVTCGRGTGVDDAGLTRKQKVVDAALSYHDGQLEQPLSVLRRLGGFEIAAMTGAYIKAAQLGIPSLIDGFIATAAALLACKINPSVRSWMLFAHRSAEQAHVLALDELEAKPILDLGLRLGEGSGAAAALPLLKTALALHNEMATFADAGVADGQH